MPPPQGRGTARSIPGEPCFVRGDEGFAGLRLGFARVARGKGADKGSLQAPAFLARPLC